MLIFQLLDLERRLIWQKICFMKKCYFSLNQPPIWWAVCWKNLKCYLLLSCYPRIIWRFLWANIFWQLRTVNLVYVELRDTLLCTTEMLIFEMQFKLCQCKLEDASTIYICITIYLLFSLRNNLKRNKKVSNQMNLFSSLLT